MTIKLGKNFDTSKAVKSLVRGYKLVPHIDRFLPTWDETGFTYTSARKGVDDAWHPSGDCTPSLNDLYHKAVNQDAAFASGAAEERKLSPSLVKTFQVGHFWHQWLQWIVVEKLGFADWGDVERRGMKGWGYTSVSTVREVHCGRIPWRPWNWATGSGDLAPVTLPEHGEYIADFKTMNARDYNQEGPPDRYADKWECQINVYMDFFDLDQGLMVGICKDSPHELKEFEYKRNQPLIDAIYEKWGVVSECVFARVEPPLPSEKGDGPGDFKLPLQGTSK